MSESPSPDLVTALQTVTDTVSAKKEAANPQPGESHVKYAVLQEIETVFSHLLSLLRGEPGPDANST